MPTARAKDRESPGDRVVHETLETLRLDVGTAELEVASGPVETSDSPAATSLSVDDGTVHAILESWEVGSRGVPMLDKTPVYMTDATTLTRSPMPAVARQLNCHLPQASQGALERARAAIGPSRIVGRREWRDGIGVARQPGTAMQARRSGDREIYEPPLTRNPDQPSHQGWATARLVTTTEQVLAT